MKERPILFNGEMVRAILEGRKTQTRRLFGKSFIKNMEAAVKLGEVSDFMSNGSLGPHDSAYINSFCPFGQPGDRLWVRENFQPIFADGFDHDSLERPDYKTGHGYKCSYPATDGIQEFIDFDDNITDRCTPSIHMPRWASRITLEITGVRVERLQQLTTSDMDAEGVSDMLEDPESIAGHGFARAEHYAIGGAPLRHQPEIYGFADYWDSIYGAGSWESNPFVWVIEFKKIDSE